MYERFTDRSRKVMQLANANAVKRCNEYVGTEDILVGLISEGSGVAANVLKNLDVNLGKVQEEIDKAVGENPVQNVSLGRLPLTPRSKKVVEYTIEEARKLDHNYVGTEHILLGLLREKDGVACQVLETFGLRLDRVREEVLDLLGHGNKDKFSDVIKFSKKNELFEALLLDIFNCAAEGLAGDNPKDALQKIQNKLKDAGEFSLIKWDAFDVK